MNKETYLKTKAETRAQRAKSAELAKRKRNGDGPQAFYSRTIKRGMGMRPSAKSGQRRRARYRSYGEQFAGFKGARTS